MILYYAVGGGLGHLTRARAVIHTLHLSDVTILTASDHALDARVVGTHPVIAVPHELRDDLPGYRRWLVDTLASLRPTDIFVDSFPAGLFGELCDTFHDTRTHFVSRALRWDRYRARVRCVPHYDETLILEQLETAHRSAIDEFSSAARDLELSDPPHTEEHEIAEPYSLVVHSGPGEEVESLVRYATESREIERVDERLVVVGPGHLDLYPATPLFARASRVFTACGFNVMRQMQPWRDKHTFIPFERALDDQFARAARARRL